MKFISPLKVFASKCRQFILNLNQFRNTHYRTLNNAKVNYKKEMESQIKKSNKMKKMVCVYTVYNKSRRRFDIGNVCSIHQKFFEDAFVELGKLPDDSTEYIPMVIYKYGSLDKDNPRVEIEVLDITEDTISYLNDLISNELRKEIVYD